MKISKLAATVAVVLAGSVTMGQANAALNLSTEQAVQQVVDKYAPKVHLHGHDIYMPSNVPFFLKDASIYAAVVSNSSSYDNLKVEDTVSGYYRPGLLKIDADNFRKYVAQNTGREVTDPKIENWLHSRDPNVKYGDLANSETYVQVNKLDANTLAIKYNYFYPYNGDGRMRVCYSSGDCGQHEYIDVGQHEGDWEDVTVMVDIGTEQVKELVLSAHGDQKKTAVSDVDWDGSHPIVYSAKYSHAFYPKANPFIYYSREWSMNYLFGTASVDLVDKTSAGPTIPMKQTIIDGNLKALQDLAQPEWLGYTGRWGPYEKQSYTYKFAGIGVYNYEDVGAGPGFSRTVAGVYQHADYLGYQVKLAEGRYTLADLERKGMIDKDISSIKLQPDYVVRAFENSNFTGKETVFTKNTGWMDGSINDSFSSFIVEHMPFVEHSGAYVPGYWDNPMILRDAAGNAVYEDTLAAAQEKCLKESDCRGVFNGGYLSPSEWNMTYDQDKYYLFRAITATKVPQGHVSGGTVWELPLKK